MTIDTSTTLVSICAIVAVLGVQSLFFWLREGRKAPWLGWFGAAFLCGAASVELHLLPAAGMQFAILGIGNALYIAGFALLWHAMRAFAGRRPEHLVAVLAIAIWLGLSSMPQFIAAGELRLVVSSCCIILFCGLAAWELWRIRAEQLPSIIPIVAVYGSFAVFAVIRMPFVGIAPFPIGMQPTDGAWLAATGLLICFYASFLAMLTLSMTRERREAEQRHEAMVDPLTMLLNRRAFLDAVKDRERRRKEMSGKVGVLVLDLDHFKAINDRYGHEAGDQVLQHFAELARASTRPADLLHRMGGEEFCFVLPGVTAAEAHMVAERIRQRFAEAPTLFEGQLIPATVSIGVAATTRENFDLELLLAAADGAVYVAKSSGRNCTAVADSATVRLESLRPSAAAA